MFSGFDFDAFFEKIREQRILIIGDVMIDTYLWGKVDRVSPEAPVPIVSNVVEESRLGGAANVALNVKAMGAIPILCSVIGGDKKGHVFLKLLEEQNLSDVGIKVDDYRVTTQKTRVISGFKHLLRVDEEIENTLSKRVQDSFVEIIFNLMDSGGIDSIIIQDYDKGVVTPSLLRQVIGRASKLKIPVMADPKVRNFHRYKNIALYKPNHKELIKGLRIDASKSDLGAMIEAGKEFREKNNFDIMMITLSDKGVLVISEKEVLHYPVFPRKVTDVSGAGDTMISVASICFNAGMSVQQIAIISNLAGGQVCEKSGVVPVIYEQLLKECKELLD